MTKMKLADIKKAKRRNDKKKGVEERFSAKGVVVGRNGYWPITGVRLFLSKGSDGWGHNDDWVTLEGLGQRGGRINGGIRFSQKAMSAIVAWWLNAFQHKIVKAIATHLEKELSGEMDNTGLYVTVEEFEEHIQNAIDTFEGGERE